MERNGNNLSFHNQCVMEQLLEDFQKEILKLRLTYEYVGRYGFDSGVDNLLGECVSFIEQYVNSFSLFFDCVSAGIDMNQEEGEEDR